MKKIFTLIAGIAFAANVNATPYKALYVEAYAEPTAGGKVYLSPKSQEDEGFVYDISDEEGESAFIKWVGGENSDGNDYQIGCTKQTGLYEVNVYAFPNDGYELVCYANTIKDDGIYTEDDCYGLIHGENAQAGWTFDFEYTGNADKINVNNVNHPQDGHSSDGPTREEVFADFDQYVSETPDTYVYVIFRKIGDELPKFVQDGGDGIANVNASANNDGVTYNVAGQQVTNFKGIVVRNGKKYLVK
ncbi:MAG: hypothetical protein IJ196_07470 [Prevotella sp.]|nr:hypothetical protein [Prevotella sp.]